MNDNTTNQTLEGMPAKPSTGRRPFFVAAGIAFGLAFAGIAVASRNSSGTYSLPSGNPVTTATTITSTWANNTLGDISTELTDSLDRSGKGGMLAPMRVTDGLVSAPSISFTSETGSGLFRNTTNDVRMCVAGILRQKWSTTGSVVNGTLGVTDTTGGKTVTLTSVSGMAADYALTFPSAVPGSTLPVSMSGAGVLSTGQITTAQIGSSAITRGLLPSVGQQTATSSTVVVNGSTGGFIDVSNATVTITTTGRPVVIMFQSDGTGVSSLSMSTTGAATIGTLQLKLLRGATAVAQYAMSVSGASGNLAIDPGRPLIHLDAPTAGTYTYKLQVNLAASNNANFSTMQLVAYEL